jgi:predicted TIM-barrel fold metal-dependent hydrolase
VSGIVFLPGSEGVRLARAANDQLAAAVAHPDRFAGFATLPMTDPEAAANELERAVRSLGLKGAMINGTTHGRFLDDPSFLPILERSEARENVLPGVMTLLKRRRKLKSSD